MKLLPRYTKYMLELHTAAGNTTFCYAAASGYVDIVKIMVKKNSDLPNIVGHYGSNKPLSPIMLAVSFGHHDMTEYLLEATDFQSLPKPCLSDLFCEAIQQDNFDLCVKLLRKPCNLVFSQDGIGKRALDLLAQKRGAISTKDCLNRFQHLANSIHKSLFQEAKKRVQAHLLLVRIWSSFVEKEEDAMWKYMRAPSLSIFPAARLGNIEFLLVLFRQFPDMICMKDEDGRSLFHVAAMYRHDHIFKLIHELGPRKFLITASVDTNGDQMLRNVAELPPLDRLMTVVGPAFQLQRELIWFYAVEKLSPRVFQNHRDKDGHTPRDIFSMQHKSLRQDGEKWMKDTSSSCMVVAALITTVLFASILTVPGGTDETSGFPHFAMKAWFHVFTMSTMVGLYFSILSVMFFLSILTSRFQEDDFLRSLPTKLVIGLMTLFVSIVAMILAFTASLVLMHQRPDKGRYSLIFCFAIVTALSFLFLHVKLWVDTLGCVYRSLFLLSPQRKVCFIRESS